MMVDSGEKSELEVKVIDFGLAKALNAVAEADLTHGSFVGTPAFASPEQFAGMPANARSDIYSLGVTLWYALTGQVPNPGQTIPEIRARQQEWSLPIEQLKQRKVPASLIEILRSALALDPARRPTSAKDLLGKLEDCRSKIRAPFRRRILALAVVLLLMLAAISVFFLRKNPPRAAEKSSASSELPTSDLTAFALYNEARNLSVRTDLNEWSHKRPQVIALLQEAIARDPKFVLAYCSLANVYAHAHTDAFVAGQDSEPVDKLWREAIDHALQLRPDLGEPHLALAGYDLFLSKFDQARAEIGIARRLLPDNSDALFVEARIDRRQNRWVDSLVPALRAHDLDPQNAGLIEWIIEDYRLLRRYDEGERFATQAMVKKPEFTSTLYERIAEMKLCEGEPAAAQEILERLSPERGIGARFEAALYLRDYDRAAKVLAAAPVDKAENISDGKPPPSLADATLARARGDERAAQAAFQGAREDLENRTKPRNRNEFYFSSLAVLDAGLGRKAEAIREAQRAVDLVPLARDPVFGMAMIEGQAQVYAWTGEDDLALKKLELLSKIPSEISYGNLRFDPGWDSLRGNPRFEKIVASLKPNAQRPTTR